MTNGISSEETKAVLERHWRDFRAGDVESIMADYAEDAMLVSSMGVLKGRAQIRPAFDSIFAHLLPPGQSTFKLEKETIEGALGYIIWTGKGPAYDLPFATDTFWVKDGKISVQTFAAQMVKRG